MIDNNENNFNNENNLNNPVSVNNAASNLNNVEILNVSNDTLPKAINEVKKGNKLLLLIITILLLALIALGVYYFCFKDKNSNKVENIVNDTVEDIEQLDSTYTIKDNSLSEFDLAFLKLNNTETDIVYSPLSIKYALAMLSEGTSGKTKTQIDNVIGNYTFKKYTNSANMSLANAMFIKNTYKDYINSTYISNLQSKYNADVIYDDFTSANTINNWVSDKTLNLINNLMDDDNVQRLDLALVNSLGIDMEWVHQIQISPSLNGESSGIDYYVYYQNESCNNKIKCSDSIQPYNIKSSTVDFDNERVSGAEFAVSANKYDIITTLGKENMKETLRKAYADHQKEDPTFTYDEETINNYIETISKNYGKFNYSTDFYYNVTDNEKVFAKDLKTYDETTLEYVGIMPTNDTLMEYINKINSTKLNELINSLKDAAKIDTFEEGYVTRIRGSVPMFKTDYNIDLINNLKSLGISDVFDPNKADLTKMVSSSDEKIVEVNHAAKIEFSNDGIKAGATTEVGGLGNAGGWEYYFEVPYKEIDLTFDKPYMYIIRDKSTGEVWFAGTVYNPNKLS